MLFVWSYPIIHRNHNVEFIKLTLDEVGLHKKIVVIQIADFITAIYMDIQRNMYQRITLSRCCRIKVMKCG